MTTIESTSVQRIRNEEHSTLESLANELFRQQESKIDDVVDTRRMTFRTFAAADWDAGLGRIVEETGEMVSRLTYDQADGSGSGGGPVNEHAHRQIRERLGIPARYYDRMRADAPGLLDENVQHWLHNAPEKRMVRMLDGKVRAFLSNRYRRLDNLDLMERAVLPELSSYEGRLVFHVAALTDERLYIRAILPDLAADITLDPTNHNIRRDDGGDVVQAGVEIRNSEVGSGALSVAPFIWRLRCLNGLVMAQAGLSRYHLGREQEETAYAFMRDDTLAADDRAFWMKVRDAVGAALSDATFYTVVGQLRETLTGEKVADPVAATERLSKTFDLNDGEGASVLRYLAEGGDLSKWGMVNAVTSAAKEADDFTRQAELEALGGALVALPENEWVRIAR